MSRAKLFVQNFLSYGFITILDRLIPFIFLPIITRLLPDSSDFGIFDIFNVILQFGSTFVVASVYNATLREYFEKDDQQYKNTVATTTFTIVLVVSTVLYFLFIIFNKLLSNILINDSSYGMVIVFSGLAIFVNANIEILRIPAKIQNHRKVYLWTSLFKGLSQKMLAIALILIGWSYWGLIYSVILSGILLAAYFWKKYYVFLFSGRFDRAVAKELLRFGLPLLPTAVIFWIYNSIDRVMIVQYLGLAELGVYGIGSRMAQISHIIYIGFSIGWGYFAYATMKDADYKYMIGRLWSVLWGLGTSFFLIVFLFKDILFNMLFEGDYVRGVMVFPYLFLTPILTIFVVILETQFIVIKRTYFSPIFLGFGCLINIILNIILIPKLGIVGAALATVIGYVTSLVCLLIFVVFIKKLVVLKSSIFWIVLLFFALFIKINISGVGMQNIILISIYIGVVVFRFWREAVEFVKKLLRK